MKDSRRKLLYAQLRMILVELLWSKPEPEKEEVVDDGVLRIHASEAIGMRERMM